MSVKLELSDVEGFSYEVESEDGKDTYKPEKIVILRVPDGKLQREALDMAYKLNVRD